MLYLYYFVNKQLCNLPVEKINLNCLAIQPCLVIFYQESLNGVYLKVSQFYLPPLFCIRDCYLYVSPAIYQNHLIASSQIICLLTIFNSISLVSKLFTISDSLTTFQPSFICFALYFHHLCQSTIYYLKIKVQTYYYSSQMIDYTLYLMYFQTQLFLHKLFFNYLP